MTIDARKHVRFALHWRIGVLYDDPRDLELFYATTNSISMTGCSIYLDRHILVEHPVMVHLTIPPDLLPSISGEANEEGKHITITALMKYGYLCRARLQFRVGLDFIGFLDDGQDLLAEVFVNVAKLNMPT